MEDPNVLKSSLSQWRTLVHHSLSQRASAAEFRDLCKLMIETSPLPAKKLIDIVLESRCISNVPWDPLIPLYVDIVSRVAKAKMHDILISLLEHSTISEHLHQPVPEPEQSKLLSTLMTDCRILQRLITIVTSGHAPKTVANATKALVALADWILSLLAWNSKKGDPSGLLASSSDVQTMYESLGILLAAFVTTEKAVEALSVRGGKGPRTKLSKALSAYIPLCDGISVPLRNRLDAVQKNFNLYDDHRSKLFGDAVMEGVNASALEFESNIMDGPILSSRAGLYIYINALLVGRPLIDDSMLINYLNNRYGGHHVALVEQIITAAFDVLSNGMYRNESKRNMFLFRAFLVNKLPPFLAEMYASSMTSIPMEHCFTRALSHIDPNTFPSFSETFSMQGNSILSDVRQEFLFASALHKLIPEASIERLLGENPMQTLPVGGQYMKDDLVNQISSNPERAEQLLYEIESMEGNAGAIARAIAETIHGLCSRKETMTLKSICSSLSRRPHALDVMLLFISPAHVLQPLCSLLDAWKWGEDQGESQPVYDEFGSILLLVLAFKYKYNLSANDIGIDNTDSFVLRLLERGSSAQRLEELSEKQAQNVGAWITSLFIAEGISDESMSSCSPQEFYLLVATLFSQSLVACENGKLEFETLKGGFEYLLEPFLLPSLVMALTWLSHRIWESDCDLTMSLKILHALIKPSSISGEAQEIHRTVLFITAKTLEQELKDVRGRHPNRADIKPILDAIEPYHSFQRTGEAYRTELESWAANSAGGGIVASIRNTFSSLVLWSSNPEISMTPPSYTHRQVLTGIKLLGSVRVLRGLIDELKLQAETGSGDLAIDVAATLVCAPIPESFAAEQSSFHAHEPSSHTTLRSPVLTLRDALNLERGSIGKMIETDSLRAEQVIRLHRRVEALSSVPQMAQSVPNIDVNNIMQDINLEGEQIGMGGAEPGPAGGVNGGEDTAGDINDMLNVAAAAAGDSGMGQDIGMSGMDTNIDDMLNADVGVGNPEFLDLDGMF